MTHNTQTPPIPVEETKLFLSLSPDLILTSVERFGVRCSGRVLQLNSMENRVYEVELDEPHWMIDGVAHKSVIAKFYRPGRWSAEQIGEEHSFLLDLAAQEIPVVSPFVHPQEGTLLTVAGHEIYFSVFPKRRGRAPDEFTAEEATRFGRLIARMHNVGAAKPAKARVKLTPKSYGRDVVSFLLAGEHIPAELRSSYEESALRLCELAEPLLSDIPTHRIHGDLHLGNILFGLEGIFLVDFDDMVVGPAVQDLWLIIPGRDKAAKESLDALLEGYEEFRPFDRSTLGAIEALRGLRFIHYAGWIAKRWSDPAFPRAFPQFGTFAYWREQIVDLQEQCRLLGHQEEEQ